MQTEILNRSLKRILVACLTQKTELISKKYFFQNPTSFGPKDVEKPKKFYLKKSPLFLHAFSKIA
jgi:hypothetical protein